MLAVFCHDHIIMSRCQKHTLGLIYSKFMFKKIDKLILDIIEGMVGFFVVFLIFGSMLAVVFAIPIIIVVAILGSDWQGAFIGLLCELGAIYLWRISIRLSEKLKSAEN